MSGGDAGSSCSTGSAAPAAAAEAPPRQQAPPRPVDFVCEADVRAAIGEKRTICVGPRTIVTPSARDLAEAAGVFLPVKG